MKTYQFELVIGQGGIIVLPREMRNLEKHRVKLTVVDLDMSQNSPLEMLEEITQKYAAIKEDDLDITGIYEQRERCHDRGIVFD